MRSRASVALISLLAGATPAVLCQTAHLATTDQDSAGVDQNVPLFQVRDKTLIESLSVLSHDANVPLHLGIEEVLRQRLADPVDRGTRFALALGNATVREILNAICAADDRYLWVVDGSSVNVLPVARKNDSTDLLKYPARSE